MSTCKALTKSGHQCKRQAPSGTEYCHQHQQHEDAEREPPSRSELWGAAKDVAVVGAAVATVATSYLLKKLLDESDGLLAGIPAASSGKRASESAKALARELLNSGRGFVHVVEAASPSNKGLSVEEEEDIKEAFAEEAVKKLKEDPELRRVIEKEIGDLRRTLPGNALANALVQAVAFLGI